MVRMKWLAGLLVVSTLGACGGADAPEADTEAVVAEPAGGMEGMEGMDGMPSIQQGGITPQLQAHMQMMESASGDQLTAMVPEHRQLVANMIAQMNREMREMNMTTDAKWNETVDALRNDLVQLPEMAADEIKAFLPEHQARINQLAEMHSGMMGNMKM